MQHDPRSALSSQRRRLIRLAVDTESEYELVVDSFSGTEALSQPFSYQLSLLSLDRYLELKTLIGKKATLEIELGDYKTRYIHGYISHFSYLKTEGDLGYYSATLSSGLWLLSLNTNCRIFQDCNLPEVLQKVFSCHAERPEYRFKSRADSTQRHSCVTQFNETDEQFVRRLLEEDGFTFYFEHTAKGHVMVIDDYMLASPTLAQQPVIEYRSEAIPGKADCISEWSAHRQQLPDIVSQQAFSYEFNGRSYNARRVSGHTRSENYLRYEFIGQDHVNIDEPILKPEAIRADALHVQGKTFRGASNCRAMTVGYFFELENQPDYHKRPRSFELAADHPARKRPARSDVTQFLLLSVQHQGRNNYLNSEEPVYSNTFSCIRRNVAFRPQRTMPRPVMPGPLTAKVVGEDHHGEINTDELGRVRVRFHWQLQQPAGTYNSRLHSQSTIWLRVAQPSAGTRYGHQFLPRIGQEVVVSFLAGDINSPLITGVVHNGDIRSPNFSRSDYEQTLPDNKALSGIKTKEHGGDGYNELLFDDTQGQVRTRLGSTHQESAISLGRLTQPRRKGQAQPIGNGADLRTHAAIALRAAQGMLLTTYAKHQAQDNQLGREALLELLDQCAELFQTLGQTATGQGSSNVDHAGINSLRQSLNRWPAPDGSVSGDPLIALTSEAGIATATPASQVHYAGQNHDTTAHEHLQMTSGAGMRLHAGKGLFAFAQEEGISAIANRGKVLVQAQDDDITVNAQKNMHASATEGEIVITAPTIRLIADDGSYIKIGGGVEIGTSGSAVVHAAGHDWKGPKTDQFKVDLPVSAKPICLACLKKAALSGVAKVVL